MHNHFYVSISILDLGPNRTKKLKGPQCQVFFLLSFSIPRPTVSVVSG